MCDAVDPNGIQWISSSVMKWIPKASSGSPHAGCRGSRVNIVDPLMNDGVDHDRIQRISSSGSQRNPVDPLERDDLDPDGIKWIP